MGQLSMTDIFLPNQQNKTHATPQSI